MSYLQRTGNSRNNISWTNTSNNTIKYLHRTGNNRTNIKWSTISTSANILQRTGNSRNNIKWEVLTVKSEQAIKNREMLDAYMKLINDNGGARYWYSERHSGYGNLANPLTILDNGLKVQNISTGGDRSVADGIICASLRYSSSIPTRIRELDDLYAGNCKWRTSNIYADSSKNYYTGESYLYKISYFRSSGSSSLCMVGLDLRTGSPEDTGTGLMLVNADVMNSPVYVYD